LNWQDSHYVAGMHFVESSIQNDIDELQAAL